MNIQLEKLFEKHEFSAKDKYDFMQIYSLLPSFKKVNVVDNFQEIVASIGHLKKDMLLEQEILFGSTLKTIEERLKNMKQDNISQKTKGNIELLKNTLS